MQNVFKKMRVKALFIKRIAPLVLMFFALVILGGCSSSSRQRGSAVTSPAPDLTGHPIVGVWRNSSGGFQKVYNSNGTGFTEFIGRLDRNNGGERRFQWSISSDGRLWRQTTPRQSSRFYYEFVVDGDNLAIIGRRSTLNYIRVGSTPVALDLAVSGIAAGSDRSMAILSDGSLWAWGAVMPFSTPVYRWGSMPQLGIVNGNHNGSILPARIVGHENVWRSVSGQGTSTLAIRADGTLWAWGDNTWGQLGIGSLRRTIPVQVGSDSDWTSVSSNMFRTAAIRTDGTLWTWGNNNYGVPAHALFPGSSVAETPPDRFTPTQFGAETDWASVELGYNHAVALKTNGTLWAWGDNRHGQLGISADYESTPIQISPNTNWANLSAGWTHTVALKTDGTLWAWGSNSNGQLGDGTNIGREAPVQVGSDTWASVSAGNNYTVAIRTDGSLWAWGWNFHGQLGNGRNGTSVAINVLPIQIGTYYDWIAVSAGEHHTMAVRADGTLWTWGRNHRAQLGNGTLISRNAP